jgi:hypothetical protein
MAAFLGMGVNSSRRVHRISHSPQRSVVRLLARFSIPEIFSYLR